MAEWSDKTTYQGKKVNHGSLQILQAANKMLRTPNFGSEKEDVTMLQGSYNGGGVSASAGTHDGGGAFDLTPFNAANRVKVFRLLGVALWDRPTIHNLWNRHLHGIVCGDGTASSGAKSQVTEYYAGQDGLAGNGRDKGWRPKELPILFVFNADIRTRYALRTARLYDEPNTRSTALNSVSVGDAVTPIALVNVNGVRWFITANGKCGKESDFTIHNQIPTPPAEATFRALTLNVNGRYMGNYSGRVPGLAGVRSSAKASIVFTQESGDYAQGAALNKAFGWGGVRYDPKDTKTHTTAGFILHGGSVPITTAVHWDPEKYTVLEEGQFVTGTNTHRWATWVLLKAKDSGVIFFALVTHLQYLPKGPNNIRKYDVEREESLASALKQATELISGFRTKYKVSKISIIAGMDANGDRNDPYDGPGKGAARYNLVDAENIARVRVNGDKGTNIEDGKFNSGDRLDRWFVPVGTVVSEQSTFFAYPYTDHCGVSILVTLSNN